MTSPFWWAPKVPAVAQDGRQIAEALAAAGHPTDRPQVLIDLIFGAGMGQAWRTDSEVIFNGKKIVPSKIGRVGDGEETVFFVPAHRAMLISDGWAMPFQKLTSDTPVVARIFSQNLFDRFNNKDADTLFPQPKRLKQEIRAQIDDAIFHGGRVGVEEDRQHAKRLRLIHGQMHLPFMTWTSGQREFTPLLLGLYHLLPSTKSRKREDIEWVVIEEPEMGLHPQAVNVVILLTLDLLWRGYKVILSTHSPHILTALWMLQRLKEHQGRWQLVCEALGVPRSPQFKLVAEAVLTKTYRAHLLAFGDDAKVRATDICSLDPGADDPKIAGWGGLTELSSRFGDAVRQAVNESEQ